MSFELFIGGRYIRAKRSQAFISLITLLSIAGVTVGVMALIVVIAVMAGFESDLRNRILGVQSHIVLMRQGGGFSDYQNAVKRIENTDGVEAATPFVYTQAMLRSAGGTSGAVIRGIDPDTADKVVIHLDPKALKTLKAPSQGRSGSGPPVPGILLGRELAKSLGVITGDTVFLISPAGSLSPVGHMPSMHRYRVTGYFESGMYEYDGTFAFIDLADAQRTLRMGDTVTGIEVRVKDLYQAGEIAKKIVAELGFPYWARDWMQMNRNFFSALKLEKTVMFIILTLIILVAAFNIASSLIMTVMEKTKDIAILKAMGATDRSILKIFVYKGMFIGLIGTALGVSLGFLLCGLLKKFQFIELPSDVYYITKLPVQLETLDVVLISIAALVICFLATLYPARQASRLDPVDAIRYG